MTERSMETRALLALYRNHPDTGPKDQRWGEKAKANARSKRDVLLAWAATVPDYRLKGFRNLGNGSVAWIRAHQAEGHTTCPVCGSPVRVVSNGAGTSYYDPIQLDTVFAGPHNGCTYDRAHVHPEDSPEEAHYLPDPAPLDADEEAWSGAVGAMANMLDFIRHGKATLTAEEVTSLKALLELDLSLIGKAFAATIDLRDLAPDAPLDVERLETAWIRVEMEDERKGVVGRGRFIDRLAREYAKEQP